MKWILIAAVLALAACTTNPTNPTVTPTVAQQLQADVDAAGAIACAQTGTPTVAADPIGCTCFTFLSANLANPKFIPQGDAAGPISEAERIRIVTNNLKGGLPPDLLLACGPLYADEHGKLLSAAAFIAAIVPK